MDFASVERLRALDAAVRPLLASSPCGDRSSNALLLSAAMFLADRVSEIASCMPRKPFVLAVCGSGDNGRDAAEALAVLGKRGFETRALSVSEVASGSVVPLAGIPSPTVVLDGITGIGLKGELRPEARSAIEWINAVRAKTPFGRLRVVAVDLPSGLPADAETIPEDVFVVRADETLTMGLPKRVFAAPGAMAWTGEIRVAPIYGDFPGAFETDAGVLPRVSRFWAENELAAARGRRQWNAHKGTHGKVAIFAGSALYPGAAMLATLGALRGGAGIVQSFVPEFLVPAFTARAPEAIFTGVYGTELSPRAVSALAPSLGGAVVAVGPGVSRRFQAQQTVAWLLSTAEIENFVVDADALFALGTLPKAGPEALPTLFRGSLHKSILTPHPGEAARLLGVSVGDVEKDRAGAVREIAVRSGAVVILKGAGSLVAAPGFPTTLVAAGSPALARGGSGDILCGVVAALLARGLSPFDAACSAVLLHGRAATAASLARSDEAFVPTDLLDALDR